MCAGPLVALLLSGAAPVPPAAPTRDPKTVVFLLEFGGLGLFPEEEHKALRLLHAWTQAQGLQAVPPDRALAVLSRARAGRSVRDNVACGMPLPDFAARQRWASELAATGVLHASASCSDKDGSCALQIDGYDALDFDGAVILEYEAPLDPQAPWFQGLSQAFTRLQPATDPGTGGLGLLGGLGDGVVQAKPERFELSAWPARETDRLPWESFKELFVVEPTHKGLRACFSPAAPGAELLIDVDKKGRVARCTSRNANDAVSGCACAALRKGGRGKGLIAGKRAHVGVSLSPADIVTAQNAVASASVQTYLQEEKGGLYGPIVSDPSIREWRPPTDHVLAACVVDTIAGPTFGAQVTVTFDSAGVATGAEVRQSVEAALTKEQLACIERAFLSSQSACPAVAGATAKATVRFSVRPIGGKLPGLDDLVKKQ